MKAIINNTAVELIGIQEIEYNSLKAQITTLNTQIQTLSSQSVLDKAEISRLQLLVTSLEAEVAKLKEALATPPAPVESLYFHGKMENATVANSTLEGWVAPMEALDICRDLYLNSHTTSAPATIITDSTGKKALKASLAAPLNGNRVQLGVVFTENMSLPVYHMSQEIYLHPDLAFMNQYSGAIGGDPWFVLFESWMSRVPEWPGDPVSRINLGIKKLAGVGQPLKWHLLNQYIQPSAKAYTDILPRQESSEPIPFGKWFTLDVTIVTGEGDKGRTIVKIDGKPIFDVIGTTIYPGRPEITRGTVNPIKFYSADKLVSFLTGAGKKVEALFGDFKFYKQ